MEKGPGWVGRRQTRFLDSMGPTGYNGVIRGKLRHPGRNWGWRQAAAAVETAGIIPKGERI